MIWRGSGDSSENPPEKQAVGDPNREAAASAVGERIESVLDAAERAAVGIREDAQEWARRYLEESRRKADDAAAQRIQELSSLTDSLVSRAKAVAQQSDELIAALDDAGRRMLNSARPGSEAAPAPPANDHPEGAPAPPASVLPTQAERPPSARAAPAPSPIRPAAPPAGPVEPAPTSAPPAQPAAEGAASVSEGARLLAAQMAVAGSTRDEIAWRLRDEFGIKDATAILDAIGI
jgi:hypothetical protein